MAPAAFMFGYGAALEDTSLYIAGVARDLEERDVPHTILWERLQGTWKRYQWKNRTYGVAAYAQDGGNTAVYMGYEGTIKVRSTIHGSSEEILEAGDDGPSSLRTIASIRVIGDHVYVAGMRRMVYRRSLSATSWGRFDDGMRQSRAELSVAGLYSIDGYHPAHLYCVGKGGEIWQYQNAAWRRLDSPTNLTLLAVRCLTSERTVFAGEKGALWVGSGNGFAEIPHGFSSEIFSCIEEWRGRCFVVADSGAVYELTLGAKPSLEPFTVEGLPSTSWVHACPSRVYFFGVSSVVSLGDAGWHDESPPAALTT